MKIYKLMKFYKWFNIVSVFFVVPAYAQQNTDTTFIFRDSTYRTVQSVFIENNKDSKLYNKLNDIEFVNFYKENYGFAIKILKKNKIALQKVKPIIPITRWLPLKLYQNTFYAYYPCDFINFQQTSINDSVYIEFTGEGLIAKQINSQIEINDSTFQFKLTGPNKSTRDLIIHIIDRKYGIAVFEEKVNNQTIKYYLMIDEEKVKSVALIVNNGETNKQVELQFGIRDYFKLLKL